MLQKTISLKRVTGVIWPKIEKRITRLHYINWRLKRGTCHSSITVSFFVLRVVIGNKISNIIFSLIKSVFLEDLRPLGSDEALAKRSASAACDYAPPRFLTVSV